jgi:hypothetical protein
MAMCQLKIACAQCCHTMLFIPSSLFLFIFYFFELITHHLYFFLKTISLYLMENAKVFFVSSFGVLPVLHKT